MNESVRVEYIGKKEIKYDNVAGTGAVWNGKGDVVEIGDPLAVSKLLGHPTIWRMAGSEPEEVEAPAEDMSDVDRVMAFDDKNLLEAFMIEKYGVNLDKRSKLDVMKERAIDAIAQAEANAQADSNANEEIKDEKAEPTSGLSLDLDDDKGVLG